jgi:hypothetical protein
MLLIVTLCAVSAGVLRILWGTITLAAFVALAGLGCIFYGAGAVEKVRAAAWPIWLVMLGACLIVVAFLGALVLDGIE